MQEPQKNKGKQNKTKTPQTHKRVEAKGIQTEAV